MCYMRNTEESLFLLVVQPYKLFSISVKFYILLSSCYKTKVYIILFSVIICDKYKH